MLKINLGLDNSQLYAGCSIETVAGRLNLTTPVSEATGLVGSQLRKVAGGRASGRA